jgi:hypothetical protein
MNNMNYPASYWEHKRAENKKNAAHQRIRDAIKRGDIIRPEACDVCGDVPSERNDPEWMHDGDRHKMTIAHHWNGYDDPLNVWWVCYPCNRKLLAHDGSVSLDQAREESKIKYRSSIDFDSIFTSFLGMTPDDYSI